MSQTSKIRSKIEKLEGTLVICQGSKCKKNGGQEIRKVVKDFLKRTGMRRKIHICRTQCQGFCKAAPVVVHFPTQEWLLETTPEEVVALLEKMLEEA